MSDPYIGEIRMFGGNYAPQGWNLCDGTTLQISGNEALFQLISTTYGGDGVTNFKVPDLRGRLPIHMSGTFPLGQSSGVENVTLTTQQLAAHSHPFMGTTNIGSASAPANNVMARSSTLSVYLQLPPSVPLGSSSIGPAGGNQQHSNIQPYLCVNFIIALYGIFPSPT